jgi:hypothetical protein
MVSNEKSSKSSHIGNNWKPFLPQKTPNVLLTNFVTLHRLINKNVILYIETTNNNGNIWKPFLPQKTLILLLSYKQKYNLYIETIIKIMETFGNIFYPKNPKYFYQTNKK